MTDHYSARQYAQHLITYITNDCTIAAHVNRNYSGDGKKVWAAGDIAKLRSVAAKASQTRVRGRSGTSNDMAKYSTLRVDNAAKRGSDALLKALWTRHSSYLEKLEAQGLQVVRL